MIFKQYKGVALIVIGALLLAVSFLVGWTSNNLVMLSGLVIIVIGVMTYVYGQKR
jgi:hypothetical protein